MKFMSILLREGRKEDLKKKYSDKFSNEDLDFILTISDLVDFNHKYTDFVLREIEPNTDIAWWAEKIVEEIKLFDKYQSQLQKKDINQYKSLDELENAVRPFQEKEKERELEKQVTKIYEDDKFIVVKPKTEEASCKYGSNTKWCVTQKGSGHYGRYTSGGQQLYFIINKQNSTSQDYSKIAIHYDNSGNESYWDQKDNRMDRREIAVLKYAFPDLIESIEKDFSKYSLDKKQKFLTETFDSGYLMDQKSVSEYLSSPYTLNVSVMGFNNIPDLGFGHAEGEATITLGLPSEFILIDAYDLFIQYAPLKDEGRFAFQVGFGGKELGDESSVTDLGLEGWGIDVSSFRYLEGPREQAEAIRRYLIGKIFDHIKLNEKITSKLTGGKKVWTPKRFSQGYTFGKNKGLIKKLVDWLDDEGNSGGKTKLDFLVDIGKLDRMVENGKKLYSHKGYDMFLPSVNWRGHFGTFFAAAKLAGILDYRKVGNQFFLVKGPNFQDFKEGNLKAL